MTFTTYARIAATPTAAQILAALRAQLTRAQHRVRMASLRRTGLYAFSFAAPAAGRLDLFWYRAPSGAQHDPAGKPLMLALSATSFANASTKTVKLRLTSAGRRLISYGQPIKLTVRAAFVRPHARTVTWLETVVLSH